MLRSHLAPAALIAAGACTRPLPGYAILGVLAHRLRTPPAAMHRTHHRDDDGRLGTCAAVAGRRSSGHLLPRRSNSGRLRPRRIEWLPR